MGKVLHSQRLNEAPLSPWIVAECSGKLVCAHCNCVAGLAEACTHIAAVLFWIDITVKMQESKTVTYYKSYWLPPNSPAQLTPKRLCEIDFRSSITKKRILVKGLEDDPNDCSISALVCSTIKKSVKKSTHQELIVFFNRLFKASYLNNP
ncbi:uncharacterized protein LOC136078995 isoform X2 [Hydra vulgaris]|uniref:Uncharacterized protein LOC136078995 isoform X2 n=1 Tax=Hydra vulgaris TaxID=6087 RepID=A0ABM4BP04_HYDVU